ncbi:MAG: SEC-C metal-binding domain-containing protein [Bacteroidota bacterium]
MYERSFVHIFRDTFLNPYINDLCPCPCGSGRKYKQCCLSEMNGFTA